MSIAPSLITISNNNIENLKSGQTKIPCVNGLNTQRLIYLLDRTYLIPLVNFPITKQQLATSSLLCSVFSSPMPACFNFCHENTNGLKGFSSLPNNPHLNLVLLSLYSFVLHYAMCTPSHQLHSTLGMQLKPALASPCKICIGKLVNGTLLVFLHLILQIH